MKYFFCNFASSLMVWFPAEGQAFFMNDIQGQGDRGWCWFHYLKPPWSLSGLF